MLPAQAARQVIKQVWKLREDEINDFIMWNSLSMGSQKVKDLKTWNALPDTTKEQLFSFWKNKEKENLIFHLTKDFKGAELDAKMKFLKDQDIKTLRELRLKTFKQKCKEEIKGLIHSKLLNKNPDRRSATEDAVQYILEWENIYTTRSKSAKEMWIYQEGIYEPEAQTYVEEICRYFFEEAYTTTIKNEVLTKIEAETYIKEDEFFTQQDKNPYELPVQNGILNIETGCLNSFTPKKIFFNKIKASYDPAADCPNIKNFIKQITAKETDVTIIQELFGFVLCKEYFIEKAFMFYGSNGRNGKSKLLQIMTEFLGIENTSSIGLQEIEEDDFAVSNLFGKMVNISADISNHAMQHTGKFKKLTGRDTLQANRKFKNYLKFVNYAKMIFASNELPIVYTVSEAFWLRWVIVEFPYQFLPQKEIDALSDEEKQNARLQNPDVIKNLLSQEELNGLLNWSLQGYNRIKNNRDFSNNETAAEVRSNWLRKSSSVRAFCEDNLVDDYDAYITKSDFQRKYTAYCKLHKLKVQSSKAIKNILMSEYGVTESRPVLDNGDRAMVWQGVRFVTPEPIITTPGDQTILYKEDVDANEYDSVCSAVADGYNTISDLELLGFNSHDVRLSCSTGDIAEVKPGIYKKI